MKDFFSILRRFVPPYKYYLALNIFFNILASVLTLFSFALIIPILEILFKLKQASYTFMEWGAGSIKDVVINNFYYYITTIIDEKGAGFALLILGVFLMVMTFFKTAATYLSSYFMIPLRSGIVRDIRNYVYEKVVSLPIGFFTSEKKGDVMARMSGDVGEIENSIMASLDMMFKNPIMIIVCLATMFAISWQLTLFVLILLPTAGYIMGQVGKKLKRRSLEGQNQWGLLMSIIEETLGGLRIVKAFNAEDKMIKWFHDDNNRFYRISNRINRRQSLAHPMSEFLGTCTICIVLWYGGSLILSGTSSIDAASFIYYLVIFYSIINPAKDLSKKGQTVALVGQSGSGKSTMADLLPRFYDVNEGGIYIDGINIKDFRVHDLRGLMGNVNQEAILFNDSFYNNITFGVENATMEQVIEAAKIANAHDFIMATEQGYDTCIGDRGSRLSGGQRQRVSIARAILKNPPILILDEATSALDTESERLVQEALENLMRNRTTLVIAHRLSTIKDADLICVMHEGEIVERGRHDELIKLDRYYKRLVDMQKF